MITKEDIARSARDILRKVKGVPDRALIHPKRDWLIILSVMVFVLVFSVLFTFTFVVRINNDGLLGSGNGGENVKTIDRSALNFILEDYQDRTEQFELIRRQSSKYIDPS